MKIRKEERIRVKGKFNGCCAYCGEKLGSRWEVDHLLPLLRNHDNTCKYPERHNFDNFMPACVPCNRDKKTFTIEQWRAYIFNKIEVLNRDSATYRHAKRFGLLNETDMDVVFYFEKVNEVDK